MPSVRQIRRRIRSVQNTAKITRAMEMIAASKMRRAQLQALAARPYADKMRDVLGDLQAQLIEEERVHPLLQVRPTINRIEVLHITPDRGLCGGLNANLNRAAAAYMINREGPESVVAVGKKGRDFMRRTGQDIRAEFTFLGDKPTILDTRPIAKVLIDDYSTGYCDRVVMVYAHFVNTVTQRPTVMQLLPVEPAQIERKQRVGYIYEPDALTVLGDLLPRFVEMQIYHAVLESLASEQSARMVAMRNATDNAHEMIDSLTLTLNKARQEMITKEMLDIVGGAAALG